MRVRLALLAGVFEGVADAVFGDEAVEDVEDGVAVGRRGRVGRVGRVGRFTALFRTSFAGIDAETVEAQWDHVAATLEERWPKAAQLMHTARPEVLAFTAFPQVHWRKIWSTNPLERVNKEIKRRSRVVGIFPNEAAAVRLVGAVLIDLHDDWIATERRYLSEGSMAKLYPDRDNDPTVTTELEPGD